MNTNLNTEQTPKKFLQTLTILHAALVVGPGLFILVTLLLNKDKLNTELTDESTIFLYIVPLLAISAFFLSGIIFKSLLTKVKSKNSLKEKIMSYQSAFIVRMALLEGATLFAIVTFFLTAYLPLLLIAGLLLIYSFTLRPTKQKVEDDLDLTYQQKNEFDDSDRVIL